MKCIVTGAAGFIGSHLCERLLNLGHAVVGIDNFTSYYSREVKEANLVPSLRQPRFQFRGMDLRQDALDGVLEGAEVIIHLAAMPGLVKSWTEFDSYVSCNITATQRLLEAVRRLGVGLHRFILGSTSSVYGRTASGDETVMPRPISPYGITKLAAEQLCRAYAETDDLPLVTLRFFSVYGPRQRPDMAYHQFIEALLRGLPLTVYGDGHQVRGNTYVLDCVQAIVAAMNANIGEVYNVGGGETATVWDIIARLGRLAGRAPTIKQEPGRAGDQRYTFADTTKLQRHVGWQPLVSLDEGLRAQWHWQAQRFAAAGSWQKAA
jgi:nucleoside-diphosphate-sugar epimerase